MSKAQRLQPTGQSADSIPVNLGSAAGSANNFNFADRGKAVKLVGESQYDLCVAGDPIEGIVTSVENATSAGFSVGGVNNSSDMFWARADGAQATAGSAGALTIGQYVVAGTITARNTALSDYPKVCSATAQPGSTPADLATAGALIKNALFACRVVSLGPAGTGAIGTAVVIQPLN